MLNFIGLGRTYVLQGLDYILNRRCISRKIVYSADSYGLAWWLLLSRALGCVRLILTEFIKEFKLSTA